MFMKASQTIGQSTGLNLGTRRPTLLGDYFFKFFVLIHHVKLIKFLIIL